MQCPHCRVFSGAPLCPSCKTYYRIGSLLQSQKLVTFQEHSVLSALRNCSGALEDLVDLGVGPFGPSAAGGLVPPSGRKSPEKGRWPEEKGGSHEAPPTAEEEAVSERKPKEDDEEEKPKASSHRAPKKDKTKVKEKKRRKEKSRHPPKEKDRSRSPAGRGGSPEREGEELRGEALRREKAQVLDKPAKVRITPARSAPTQEDVARDPQGYGLESVHAKGTVGRHFERSRETGSGRERPPEPANSPRRETEDRRIRRDPRYHQGEEPRGGREDRRGSKHYQRGRDYWRKVRNAKKK